MRIRNWEKFQHYGDSGRRMVWIKVHTRLLDDIAFARLSDRAARVLFMLWMLASEDSGNLPDIDTIAFRLRLKEKDICEALAQLSEWLEQDSSETLASVYQTSSLEKSREENREEKKEEREKDARARAVVPEEVKKPYGEMQKVMLTDSEHAKLTEKHGAAWVTEAVAILDSYLASSPKNAKRYTSHFAVMKNGGWVADKVAEKKGGTNSGSKLVNTWHDPNPDMKMRNAW